MTSATYAAQETNTNEEQGSSLPLALTRFGGGVRVSLDSRAQRGAILGALVSICSRLVAPRAFNRTALFGSAHRCSPPRGKSVSVYFTRECSSLSFVIVRRSRRAAALPARNWLLLTAQMCVFAKGLA